MSILRAVQLQFKAGETAETIKNVEMAFPRFRVLSVMLTFFPACSQRSRVERTLCSPRYEKALYQVDTYWR